MPFQIFNFWWETRSKEGGLTGTKSSSLGLTWMPGGLGKEDSRPHPHQQDKDNDKDVIQNTLKELLLRIVTFETSDQSDEET